MTMSIMKKFQYGVGALAIAGLTAFSACSSPKSNGTEAKTENVTVVDNAIKAQSDYEKTKFEAQPNLANLYEKQNELTNKLVESVKDGQPTIEDLNKTMDKLGETQDQIIEYQDGITKIISETLDNPDFIKEQYERTKTSCININPEFKKLFDDEELIKNATPDVLHIYTKGLLRGMTFEQCQELANDYNEVKSLCE